MVLIVHWVKVEQVAVKYPDMEIQFEIPDDIRKALGF